MNVRPGLLIALGLVLVLYVFSRTKAGQGVIEAVTSGARGLRNNNPGNIRVNPANNWLGAVPSADETTFVVFSEPKYGVRALGRVLMSYERQGLRTVAGIISRFAPSTENDTSAYVRHVASDLKVDPDDPIDVRSYLPRLAASIIEHENGSNPYPLANIKEWVYS